MYTYMYISTMAFILYKDKEHYFKKNISGYLQFVFEIIMCVCSQKNKNNIFCDFWSTWIDFDLSLWYFHNLWENMHVVFLNGGENFPETLVKNSRKILLFAFRKQYFKFNDWHDVLLLYDVIGRKPFTCLLTNFNLLYFFNFGQKKCKVEHILVKGKWDNYSFAEVSPFPVPFSPN